MSHPLEEPSTGSRWLDQAGDIHLRHTEHRPLPQDGRGIVIAALVGGATLIWAYVLARLLWWWLRP